MTAAIASQDVTASNHPSRALFRFAVATVVMTVLVIVMGAMVTSTGSGLAFLDWPLSDGELFPKRSYQTLAGFFEHFHRVAASLLGILAVVLVVRLSRSPDAPPAARKFAWGLLGLVILQGIVGGVGVLLELPPITSVAHGTMAQLTLAGFAVLAYLLSPRCRATAPLPDVAPGSGRALAAIALLLLIAQTMLGATARHTDHAAVWHDRALWTHVGNAFVVFVVVCIAAAFAVGRLAAAPGIRFLGRALVWLLIAQIALGFVALLVRTSKSPANIDRLFTASLITGHVLLGALLTLTTALLVAHVHRATRRPGAVGNAP